MRLLPAAFALALAACGPTSTTNSTGDAAADATDVTAADQCGSRPMGDLAPLPPGCRVINPDPCTGRGTIVCPDAGDDATADAPADVARDAPADAGMDVCMIECAAPPPGCRYEGPVTCEPRSCGTLVCPDDAGADAPAPDASADAAPADAAIVCTGMSSTFPAFRQDCAGDSDCVVAVHQTDCCGNQRGLGLHASQRAAFDAAEAVCRPMYPRCGCPTRGVLCDDERWTFGADTIGVACRANRCTTFVR